MTKELVEHLKETAWRIATNQKDWFPGGRLKLITRIRLYFKEAW